MNTNTKYKAFELLVDVGGECKFVEVVAIDIQAAKSDVSEAFCNARVISWRQA